MPPYFPVAMQLHPSIQALLDEITAFRRQRGISATAFGIHVLNDGKFVADLKRGRVPSLMTIDKVRLFMNPGKVAA
jgi:hypothetical protein